MSPPRRDQRPRASTVSALFVPDEQAWTVWGHDLHGLGYAPTAQPAQADVLVAPTHLPESLAEALTEAWGSMPGRRRLVEPGDPLPTGKQTSALLQATRVDDAPGEHEDGPHGHEAHEGHETSDGDGEMDQHDMMVVTGEPSDDGLVMEAIDFELGPLSWVLSGGLVARLSLDGDVVAACEVDAVLSSGDRHLAPDELAPVSWAAAIARARERAADTPAGEGVELARLAAVELERAVSHLAWLRRFAAILGWPELAGRAHAPLPPLIAASHALAPLPQAPLSPPRLEEVLALTAAARGPAERVGRLLAGSRRLRARTRGLARVPDADARRAGLDGPLARAAGVVADARVGDTRYLQLGFEPALAEAGDTEARVLVRVREALCALELAAGALGAVADGPPAQPTTGLVEGPRGTLEAEVDADGELRFHTPGAAGALRTAGDLAVGLEWSDAVTALASLDLSPWRVAG